MTVSHATAAETIPALLATIKELQALQQPLVDALRSIHGDMDRAHKSGDEWATEWMAQVWNELPLAVRAAGGDQEAAQELTDHNRDAARQATGQADTEPDPATADDPIPLRWGHGDVLHSDDDTVIVCLSGPNREPYWLELEPERAAALRDDLTPPQDEQPAEAHATDEARQRAYDNLYAELTRGVSHAQVRHHLITEHRAAVLREAAELGRELSRQGYSAQEIAKRLDQMAETPGAES
ncbi:hypothetical protein ACIQMY_20845 [Streptomyces sp. NPDC091368]|uniref:hypothetical protein n=1 Tax=Streptomyces sp. NPDC091368 TaxID=3365993 RepID=UPI00382CF4AF